MAASGCASRVMEGVDARQPSEGAQCRACRWIGPRNPLVLRELQLGRHTP